MIRATSAALLLFLLAGVAFFGVLIWCGVAVHTLIVHVDSSSALLAQRWTPGKGKPDALIDAAYNFLHNTNDNLNRPCGGGKPCGTFAAIDKTVTKAGDSVVTTQLAERATVPHVLAAMDGLKDAAGKLGGTADAATATLGTAQTAIAKAEPLLDASTLAVQRFTDLLNSKSLSDVFDHFDGMAISGDAILVDGAKAVHKATTDYLRPVPWWKQPTQKAGALIDITAAVARHTP